MSIDELIIHSAEEIRRNPDLFTEYIRLYKEEKGKKPPCAGCSLASTLSAWMRSHAPKKSKMATDNTFELIKGKKFIHVPFTGRVIDDSSPDELVFTYLNQVTGEARLKREANFTKLPSVVSAKIAQVIEPTKAKTKKPRKKKSA
jgi:hypothetical protein